MALEAPFSKHSRNTFLTWAVVCVGFAAWFAYDGFFNKTFIDKHTKDGAPDSTLAFNRKAPPFLVGAAILIVGLLLIRSRRKIVADDNTIVIDGSESIPYDSIRKIDKTNFESRGFFIVTYKNAAGAEVNRTLSDSSYDNLGAVLDHLVTKIS